MLERKMTISLLCSQFADLEKVIRISEKTKVDYLHIDIMDGKFVPNFGLGLDYIKQIRLMTDMPIDFHLMVNDPDDVFGWLNLQKDDILSFHYEGSHDIFRSLEALNQFPCKKMIAINPETSIDAIKNLISYVDGVNVLLVKPGFIGQPMEEGTLEKVKGLREWMDQNVEREMEIEVDGNVSYEHAKILKEYGATLYVNGSSSVFQGNVDQLENNIYRFREIIQ